MARTACGHVPSEGQRRFRLILPTKRPARRGKFEGSPAAEGSSGATSRRQQPWVAASRATAAKSTTRLTPSWERFVPRFLPAAGPAAGEFGLDGAHASGTSPCRTVEPSSVCVDAFASAARSTTAVQAAAPRRQWQELRGGDLDGLAGGARSVGAANERGSFQGRRCNDGAARFEGRLSQPARSGGRVCLDVSRTRAFV